VHDNYTQFIKGEEKYLRDMDIMSIISTVHQTRILTDLVLNQNQQMLANFSMHRNINQETSDRLGELDDVLKYKCPGFEAKNKEFSRKIDLLINEYKHKKLSKVDFGLFTQIYPKLLMDQVIPDKEKEDDRDKKENVSNERVE
jgi:hypothetical protein